MYKFAEIRSFYQVAHSVTKRNQEVQPDCIIKNVNYKGTCKLHGTNGGILCMPHGIYAQSRSRELTLDRDNAGFAAFVLKNEKAIRSIEHKIRNENSLEKEVPIVIYGEWIGPGIQKGMAINDLPTKQWVIFSIKVIGEDSNNNQNLIYLPSLKNKYSHEGIYSIEDSPTWSLSVDFSSDTSKKEALKYAEAMTAEVEKCCPWAKKFNIFGLGEGIVWTPIDGGHGMRRSDLWFKTKGEKHQNQKNFKKKKQTKISPEVLESVSEFVDFSTTENRLLQGLDAIQEQGHDIKIENIGQYIKWVCKDVAKECSLELVESNLTWKDVQKYVSSKARKFFLENLKKNL